MGVGSAIIYAKVMPKPQIDVLNKIVFYDNSGEIFSKGATNNNWVKLKQISPYVIDATISTEDKNFYNVRIFAAPRTMYKKWTYLLNVIQYLCEISTKSSFRRKSR